MEIVDREQMRKIVGLGPNKDPPLGRIDYCEQRVFLQKVQPGVSRQTQLHTFWHEFAHAMFDTLGREKLRTDEGLVDAVGNLLLQAHQSFNK